MAVTVQPLPPGAPLSVVSAKHRYELGVTAPLNVTVSPELLGLGVEVKLIAVATRTEFTTCTSTGDVEGSKFASPLYCAVMLFDPTGN